MAVVKTSYSASPAKQNLQVVSKTSEHIRSWFVTHCVSPCMWQPVIAVGAAVASACVVLGATVVEGAAVA